ncbi:MAG TPA: DNA-processing protein DprA [Polyangiaceae bacterium]|nr:DNA-processing protein DprA [Polyangiaceae bacterium]
MSLQDLPEPPAELHLIGELPRGPTVAIVGTRHPSAAALDFGKLLARQLARAGIIILSGGAEGIDTGAHLGALEGEGRTVVVAPAGYERPFPPQNVPLFSKIIEAGGAYLSLLPPHEPAPRSGFFARNACLVALAHAVVVVEAPVRSGARNAAAWARRLGRPLLAVPSAPWISTGAGCILEIRLGARLCASSRDVLRTLEESLVIPASPSDPDGDSEAPARQVELPFEALSAEREVERVARAVGAGARHLDAVCAASGLAPAAVQRHILTLTLEGVLVADPAGGLGLTPLGGRFLPSNLSK